MITSTFSQPESKLGLAFTELLSSREPFSRIILVSAFTALRTILRLREQLHIAASSGATVRLVIGIDLGGTSREVLEELASWECEAFLYHNPLPRATFHPKMYLFERESESTLFVGSNNLTDGGLYTNYEAYARYFFELPADESEYERILGPFSPFITPEGSTVRRLDLPLVEILSTRGLIPNEIEIQRRRRGPSGRPGDDGSDVPANPFIPVFVAPAPLLPGSIRATSLPHPVIEPPREEAGRPTRTPRPYGLLVWKKVLPRTDALQVIPGSHPVGGVRLTQANFDDISGHRIDQTTYFRALFDDFDWEPEPGGHEDQEHTFIPMRVFIRGQDYGIRNFEISHKPSGEAGQANYTTILRWGPVFSSLIRAANLTGALFLLYETSSPESPFVIEIRDA